MKTKLLLAAILLAILLNGCTQQQGKAQNQTSASTPVPALNLTEMNFSEMLDSKFAISCKINLGYSGTLMRANVLMKNGAVSEKIEVLNQANQQLAYSGIIKEEMVYAQSQYQSYGCNYVRTRVEENPQLISPKELVQIDRQLAECALSGQGDEAFTTANSCTPEEIAEKVNRR